MGMGSHEVGARRAIKRRDSRAAPDGSSDCNSIEVLQALYVVKIISDGPRDAFVRPEYNQA